MTVATNTNKMPPQIMGASEYEFNFRVLVQDPTNEEARTAVKCVITDGTTETALVYGDDYTVSINADGVGGVVTVTDPKSASYSITIYREYAITQQSDYENYNTFPASTLENNLDKVTMITQQLAEENARSLHIPMTAGIENIELPAPDPAKALKWSEDGTALVNTDTDIDNAISIATDKADIATAAADASITARDDILDNAGFIAVSADLTGANNIGTVAGDLLGDNTVGIVADNIGDVVAVGENIDNVNGVVNSLTTITAVKDALPNINTVVTNIDAVTSIVDNIDEIYAVGANVPAIETCNANIDSVVAVNNNMSNIIAVKDNASNINTVAAHYGDGTITANKDGDGNVISTTYAKLNAQNAFTQRQTFNGSLTTNTAYAGALRNLNDNSNLNFQLNTQMGGGAYLDRTKLAGTTWNAILTMAYKSDIVGWNLLNFSGALSVNFSTTETAVTTRGWLVGRYWYNSNNTCCLYINNVKITGAYNEKASVQIMVEAGDKVRFDMNPTGQELNLIPLKG